MHMAVHSNTFGGVQLSGNDADAFRKQTKSRYRSESAKKTAANGIIAARQLMESGQVKVTTEAA
jgi:hypothetical protein